MWLGSMTYSYNGTSYGTVELVALSDVEMSRVLYYSDKLSHFFQSTVFKIVLIAAAIFIVLYILFNITFGGIRCRRRPRRCASATITMIIRADTADKQSHTGGSANCKYRGGPMCPPFIFPPQKSYVKRSLFPCKSSQTCIPTRM